MKWQSWLKIIIIILTLLFITIGFLVGYFYRDKISIKNPPVYWVKQLNKLNNEEFTCSCFSHSGRIDPFSFNETGINDNLYYAQKRYSLIDC